MLTEKRIDTIERFAAESLIVEALRPGNAVFLMAQKFPDASGLTFAFVLCWVASIIESEVDENLGPKLPQPEEIFKAAALLSADLFELEQTLDIAATGADLVLHWTRVSDGFFAEC